MIFDKSYTIVRPSSSLPMQVVAEIQAFFDGMEDVAPFLFHSGHINIEFEFNIDPSANGLAGTDDEITYGHVDVYSPTDYKVTLYVINTLFMAERQGINHIVASKAILAHEVGHIAFLISEPNAEGFDAEAQEAYANQFAGNYVGFSINSREAVHV